MRAVLDHKRRSGSYIASFALYGYRKDPQDHSRLLPDEPAAQVVRQIFALYLQGNGVGRIAQTPVSYTHLAQADRQVGSENYGLNP